MKVLMVGANGKFAGHVLPELTKRGITVRALVRSPKLAPEAESRGAAETVIGDLNHPESLHVAALGVDGVFHIGPAFTVNESGMGISMVRAAIGAGVRKFVFSSVLHPQLRLPNHTAKQPVEEALYESGMDYTILQPAMFMQNLQGGWKQVSETGKFVLPFSANVPLCYVDYRDVAECAALAFASDRLAYGTFELCSPGMVTRAEMAATMSEALGRPVEAAEVPFERWADSAHIPPGHMRDGLARMYAHYDRHGFIGGNALVLETILGRKPRTLRQFIQELARGEAKAPAAA